MQLLFEAKPTSMNSTPGAIEQEPAEWRPTACDLSESNGTVCSSYISDISSTVLVNVP
jgi:hypothetical protein